MLLMESGRREDALAFIEFQSKQIADKVWLWQTKAELLIELNRRSEAQPLYTQLLNSNPDNIAYVEVIILTGDIDCTICRLVYWVFKQLVD